MKMELDHVLNQTSSKIFVKMIRPQVFQKFKDPVSRPDQRLHQKPEKKTKLKPGPKAPFEIKELDDTGNYS
jgi:hypothetical protein